MDNGAYNSLKALYELFKTREGQLTEKEIGYVTGALKTLTDIYAVDPLPEEEPRKRRFIDIIKGDS